MRNIRGLARGLGRWIQTAIAASRAHLAWAHLSLSGGARFNRQSRLRPRGVANAGHSLVHYTNQGHQYFPNMISSISRHRAFSWWPTMLLPPFSSSL